MNGAEKRTEEKHVGENEWRRYVELIKTIVLGIGGILDNSGGKFIFPLQIEKKMELSYFEKSEG